MSTRYAGKRIMFDSGSAPTLQDLADFLDMACRADLPPTAPIAVRLGGTRLERFTVETEVRRDLP